ncbi:hypothetical protein [Nocardia salmonicida]|uniref:hypothetical protein n=1 Tax=Nocardia salmonicida TaxID=53431 RepID=UPI002E2C1DEA|nr:hypothetical protein [Nocardia salmonicida]
MTLPHRAEAAPQGVKSFDCAGETGQAAQEFPKPPQALMRVQIRLTVLVAGLAGAYWILFREQFPIHTSHLAGWWAPAAIATGIGTLAALTIAAMAKSLRVITTSAAVFAMSYLFMCVTWFAAVDGHRIPIPASTWIEGFSTIPAMAAAISWRMRVALVYAFVTFGLSRAIHYLNMGSVELRWAVVSIAGNLLLTVVLTVMSRVAIEAASALDSSWVQLHSETAWQAAQQARLDERDRVGDLLHDYVLAALLAAAKQPDSPEVRREAALAVHELDTDPAVSVASAVSASEAVRAIAARCRIPHTTAALFREIDPTDTSYPSTIVDAFADGAREAVRNSQRHGGPKPKVIVAVRAAANRLEVEVVDSGPGFDATQQSGFGLSRLQERILAIPGATLSIDTESGTRVRMLWSAPRTTIRCADNKFRDLLQISTSQSWSAAAAFTVAALASAAAFAGSTTPISTELVAVTVAAGAAIVLMVDRSDPLRWSATTLLALGLPAANLLVVASSSPPISSQVAWPGYLVGSFSLVLGVRGRLAGATIATVGCFASPIVLASHTGRPLSYWISESIAALMALLLCVFYSHAIRPAMRKIQQLRNYSIQRHAENAARNARTVQRQQHLATIERRARPLLQRISTQGLSPVERKTAANVEARLRATLRAPGLSHPDLDDSVDAARNRGAHVVLIDDSPAPPFADEQAFDRFIALAGTFLDKAGVDHTITVRLTPTHHTHRATIVMTKRGVTVDRAAINVHGRQATFESHSATGEVHGIEGNRALTPRDAAADPQQSQTEMCKITDARRRIA